MRDGAVRRDDGAPSVGFFSSPIIESVNSDSTTGRWREGLDEEPWLPSVAPPSLEPAERPKGQMRNLEHIASAGFSCPNIHSSYVRKPCFSAQPTAEQSRAGGDGSPCMCCVRVDTALGRMNRISALRAGCSTASSSTECLQPELP